MASWRCPSIISTVTTIIHVHYIKWTQNTPRITNPQYVMKMKRIVTLPLDRHASGHSILYPWLVLHQYFP